MNGAYLVPNSQETKMNFFLTVTAGIISTLVMTLFMAAAPKMGIPRMDIVSLLSTMFDKKGNLFLGWMMHLMMGIVFAGIYTFLWSINLGAAIWYYGLIFGAIHWLIVGIVMPMIPLMNVGIRSGTVNPPGMYMTASGGIKSFFGGLMGHMIFGLVVALVYSLS
jgi:uncharacterized membrane protein YagU involved in acid resistance